MIKFLDEINPNETYLYGNKGCSLAKLYQNKVSVPYAFIIPINFNYRRINSFKETIFNAFSKLNSKYVVVRSSANIEDEHNHSFAGIFSSYLATTKENLIKNIKKCFYFANSKSVNSYCSFKSIKQNKIKMAVIVQKMIFPHVSGACFSINPITKNENQIVIEAVFGFGKGLLSGLTTPDRYLVSKINNRIINKTISKQSHIITLENGKIITKKISYGDKQKLPESMIRQISKQTIKLEKLFNEPIDIEWAVKRKYLFIIQIRPITTLTSIT